MEAISDCSESESGGEPAQKDGYMSPWKRRSAEKLKEENTSIFKKHPNRPRVGKENSVPPSEEKVRPMRPGQRALASASGIGKKKPPVKKGGKEKDFVRKNSKRTFREEVSEDKRSHSRKRKQRI